MTISAKVIARSRIDAGVPDLITLQLRYPRFIHAEFMTHRVFSRNASSSRAIPVERMIQDVIDDPAMPVRWGANQPGMQDAGDHDALVTIVPWDDHDPQPEELSAEEAWLVARDNAVELAQAFADAGYHKQIVNRLLEPFGHISVVCTATDWDNFFDLRCHPDADPTMRALAEAMRDAIQASEPKVLRSGEWHLPYVNQADIDQAYTLCDEAEGASEIDILVPLSVAHCARVSYLNHDGTSPDIVKDLALADRLLASKHMSPFEHQATPWAEGVYKPHLSGNFTGWYQNRKIIEARQQ